MNIETVTNPNSVNTGTVVIPGLADEVVDALFPQWCVNGHRLPAAFETIAERHHDPVVRETAATTPLLPALLETLNRVFWVRARRERAMLAG